MARATDPASLTSLTWSSSLQPQTPFWLFLLLQDFVGSRGVGDVQPGAACSWIDGRGPCDLSPLILPPCVAFPLPPKGWADSGART